ncbi:GntR family transcriptional regulator [Tersicoccus solisilvae]|uniref:GntR family transcriptional regulator n=2 Tax=Tersicoccus solisilvae TaxID=1882339 RepID=A0ABQ1P1U8_9MICC|nr:GntR family transcriptional regulator [Tersicoccus solisilvae]
MAEHAYRELRARIIDLRLPPGTALDEDGLRGELGVGRTPMREAVKRLEAERMVQVYPRRGTIVTEVSLLDLRAISDARRVMEAYAARTAAGRLGEADRARFADLLERIPAAAQVPPAQAMAFDREVHQVIWAVMRNPYLEDTLGHYFDVALRLWNYVLDRIPPMHANVAEHADLLHAILDGDGETAGRLAEEHVTHFETLVRASL